MGKSLTTTLLALLAYVSMAQNQPGSIKGQVYEITNGVKETIPGASILIKDLAGKLLQNGATDFDGNYSISPLDPGKYNMEIISSSSNPKKINGVIVKQGKATLIDVELISDIVQLTTVDITFTEDIIVANEGGPNFQREEINEMSIREIQDVALLAPAATPTAGGGISMKGERPEATSYILDGVKLSRPPNIPKDAIGSVEIQSSGLAARYGDVQGGVVNTETRGPSSLWFGSAEVLSSALFDNYGYNLAAFTIGGPLLKSKDKTTKKPRKISRFFYVKSKRLFFFCC